jgi:hypothetical protein
MRDAKFLRVALEKIPLFTTANFLGEYHLPHSNVEALNDVAKRCYSVLENEVNRIRPCLVSRRLSNIRA